MAVNLDYKPETLKLEQEHTKLTFMTLNGDLRFYRTIDNLDTS